MVKRDELRKLLREKVLLVGEAGTGKTFAAVKVAEAAALAGLDVCYIDPDYGAERELDKLTDAALERIELKVVPDWRSAHDAMMADTRAAIKVIDDLTDIMEMFRKHLTGKFITQGYIVIGDEKIEITDPEAFVLPWGAWPRIYSEVRDIIYALLEHRYGLLCTMHPLREERKKNDARARLESDIYRKFDTVLETRMLTVKDTPEWQALIVKNRGRADRTTNLILRDVPAALIKLFVPAAQPRE